MAKMPTIDIQRDVFNRTQLHVTVLVRNRWITRRRLAVGLFCIRIGARIIGTKQFTVDFNTE